MLTRKQQTQLLGAALIVAGLLVLFGSGLGLLVLLGAAAAVVVGIVLLIDTRRKDKTFPVALLAIGALLLLSDKLFHAVVDIVNIVAGVLLVAAGIWVLMKA